MRPNAIRTAILVGLLAAGRVVAAEPPSPKPVQAGKSVIMRSWPHVGSWATVLRNTSYWGADCATYSYDRQDLIGLGTKGDPHDSLYLILEAPADQIASSHSLKLWIDGYLLGEFPVAKRIQFQWRSIPEQGIFAAVPESKTTALLDLFGQGGWIAYSAGMKSHSVALDGSGSARKAFLECAHDLKTLSSVGATADPELSERWNWVSRCRRIASAIGRSDLDKSCSAIWDRRAAIPEQFAEVSKSLGAAEHALAALGTLGRGAARDQFLSELDSVESAGAAAPNATGDEAASVPRQSASTGASANQADNTLEKLRRMVQQTQSKARYNPQAGGDSRGNATAGLTASQRGAIGAHVRECWTIDAGAADAKQMSVMLQVTTDQDGVARMAEVVGADRAREASDPVYRAFAERAVRAVLDPHCARLPLPQSMMGRISVVTFPFSP